MTQGVKPGQHQIEGCRYERRKRNIANGIWVPTRFRMANVWGLRETISYGVIFLIGAIITTLIK